MTNLGKTVRGIQYEEPIPANVVLRVPDLATDATGPVIFTNGAIILGVGDGGLTYTFTSLSGTTDGIDFYNGALWT